MTELNEPEFINFGETLTNINKSDNVVFSQPMNIPKPIVQNIAKNVQNQFRQPVGQTNIAVQPQQINKSPIVMDNIISRGQQPIHYTQPTIINPQATNVAASIIPTDVPDLSSYFSIFGFQISRTTIYILIGFIVLLVGYIIYSKFFSKSEEKKKKKKTQVSYKSQEEQEEQDDDDE